MRRRKRPVPSLQRPPVVFTGTTDQALRTFGRGPVPMPTCRVISQNQDRDALRRRMVRDVCVEPGAAFAHQLIARGKTGRRLAEIRHLKCAWRVHGASREVRRRCQVFSRLKRFGFAAAVSLLSGAKIGRRGTVFARSARRSARARSMRASCAVRNGSRSMLRMKNESDEHAESTPVNTDRARASSVVHIASSTRTRV